MKRLQPYLSALMTLLVGVAFVASALLKMQSIDSFELYIFSFEIFSLNIASILARLIVGVELVLGLGYLLNIYHRQFYYTLLSSLLLFTAFLVVVTFTGREDNCHCFGDLVDISPVASIFKNVGLVVALYLSRNLPAWPYAVVRELQSYLLLALIAISLYPIMRYPPRAIVGLFNGSEGVGDVDVELFQEFVHNNPQYGWGDDTKVFIFYGVGCKYCRYSAEQISHIIRRKGLDYQGIELIFWGDERGVAEFYDVTNAVDFSYTIVDPKILLDITGGKIPTIVIYDNSADSGFKTQNIRTLDEADIMYLLE